MLLLFAGIELAMACKDMNSKEGSFVMLVCAAVLLTRSRFYQLGFGYEILLPFLVKLRETVCALDRSSPLWGIGMCRVLSFTMSLFQKLKECC